MTVCISYSPAAAAIYFSFS